MIDPFVRSKGTALDPGHFIPEPALGSEWFFTQQSVATREYNGHLMRNTVKGWQFWDRDEWTDVYPKVSWLSRLLFPSAIKLSPFLFESAFESATVEYTDGEYPLGEYWLVPGDEWKLIPVDYAEQLGNINSLELHKIGDPAVVFVTLQSALEVLREDIYGVIFTSGNNRARVRPRDFDWTGYDSRAT